MVSPVLFDFIRTTGRDSIQLWREKEIIYVDRQTGGNEFVVVDEISVMEERVAFTIEAKRSSVGQAMRQILLAMEGARQQWWRCCLWPRHDRRDLANADLRRGGIRATESLKAIFLGMGEDKGRWMKDCSVLVDFLVVALSNDGIVKDMVVG